MNVSPAPRYLFLALPFVAFVGGCAPFVPVVDVKTIPQETLQAAYRVRTFTPENSPNYPPVSEYIGTLTAHSCKFLLTDPPPSKGDALLQLRIAAVEKKADALLDVTFDSQGADGWGTNCWESVQASGIAVKLK